MAGRRLAVFLFLFCFYRVSYRNAVRSSHRNGNGRSVRLRIFFSGFLSPIAASRSQSVAFSFGRNETERVRSFFSKTRPDDNATNKQKTRWRLAKSANFDSRKIKKEKKRRAAIVDRVDRLGRTKNLSLHLKMSPLFFVCVWSTFEKGNPANFPYPEGINFLRFLRFSANPQI